jgi:hypothetical protein
MSNGKGGGSEQQHIKISVVTTSGTWPADQDFATVPIHQKVRVALEAAARELKITDTSKWVAKVAGRDVILDQSWLENGFSGVVTLDYGPVESGGGGRA